MLFESLIRENCEPSYSHRWGDRSPNPYFGILTYADTLIVTGDSVSMLSDACAAPGNVYVYTSTDNFSAKHYRFHEELYAMGAARALHDYAEGWMSVQFNPAVEIAKQIRLRVGY